MTAPPGTPDVLTLSLYNSPGCLLLGWKQTLNEDKHDRQDSQPLEKSGKVDAELLSCFTHGEAKVLGSLVVCAGLHFQ